MAMIPHAVVALRRSNEDGAKCINILHYTTPGGLTVANGALAAGHLAVAANLAFTTVMKNVTSFETQWLGVAVRVSVGGQSFESEYNPSGGPGTVESDTAANYVSIVMTKYTATGGKSGRGRWYLGCVPESFTDGPAVAPAATGPLIALTNVLKATLETTDGAWEPRHYSPKLGMLLPFAYVSWKGPLGILRRRRVLPPL